MTDLQSYWFYISFWLVLSFLFFLLVALNVSQSAGDPYRFQKIGTVSTKDFSALEAAFQQQIELVEAQDEVWLPPATKQFPWFSQASNPINLKEMVGRAGLLKNFSTGFHPVVDPAQNDPSLLNAFQFGQGNSGWYWFYCPFSSDTALFMAVMRYDLVSPQVMEPLGWQPGEGTVFWVTPGISYQGQWYTTAGLDPQGGTVTLTNANPVQGTLTLADGQTVLTWVDEKTFRIQYQWDQHQIDATFTSAVIPKYNGPQGACAPCYGGQGTIYYSYTDVNVMAQLTVNGKDLGELQGTQGWIDRQWGGSLPRLLWAQVLQTAFSSQVIGFGPYVWLNIHLNEPREQYMLYGFFPEDTVFRVNDQYRFYYNRYTSEDVERFQRVNVKIAAVKTLSQVTWPVAYRVTLNDKEYLIDGRPYGDALSEDVTFNLHWHGSATLTELKSGASAGTAFMEASDVQPRNEYLGTRVSAAHLAPESISAFEKPYDSLDVFPSLFLIILLLWTFLLVLYWLVMGGTWSIRVNNLQSHSPNVSKHKQ